MVRSSSLLLLILYDPYGEKIDLRSSSLTGRVLACHVRRYRFEFGLLRFIEFRSWTGIQYKGFRICTPSKVNELNEFSLLILSVNDTFNNSQRMTIILQTHYYFTIPDRAGLEPTRIKYPIVQQTTSLPIRASIHYRFIRKGSTYFISGTIFYIEFFKV